jgi:hypothetical protein
MVGRAALWPLAFGGVRNVEANNFGQFPDPLRMILRQVLPAD